MQYPAELQTEIDAFVNERGQSFSVKSSQSLSGSRGRCFAVCTEHAMENENLSYVEGHATSPDGETHTHAWLVDDEGQLIDPTWGQDAGSNYFGVILDSGELYAIVAEEEEGCFDEGVLPLLDLIPTSVQRPQDNACRCR